MTDHFYHHLRYSIIKRRVAWLIGKWVRDDCVPANNGRIWEILVHLLRDQRSSTETAVRLTAASALRMCIEVRILVVVQSEWVNTNSHRSVPLI